MKTITVAHVSDLHLPFEPKLGLAQRLSKRQLSAWAWRRRRNIQSETILAALAAELRAADLDHMVITGDLVNFALPEEFARAAAWLQALAPADRISVVPGNHDALVRVAESEGLGRWSAWTSTDGNWPFVHRREGLALIGLNSARPTAPLLARGRIGADQLARLEAVLNEEARTGRIRVVAVHHPVASGAVSWRRALADRAELGAVLQRAGAELVLHGHAHNARLDALPGPHGMRGMIPCLCVPSSSALPNAKDEAARWHRLSLSPAGRAEVAIRQWSAAEGRFVDAGGYELCLPRRMTDASPVPAFIDRTSMRLARTAT
ncbi:MAG: metallophosphoesterase [Betaproteobacteria bacterium]|nr:metallophosphoesterase [Betaproteobacteria bacterium]